MNRYVFIASTDYKSALTGNNIYHVEIENATFRSAQSMLPPSAFTAGNTGIVLRTNRFRYWIRDNEFTNIKNGVNIPITAGPSTLITLCAGCYYGVYAGNLTIQNNVFGPGTGTNNYVSQAIDVTAGYSGPWTMLAAPNLSPTIVGTFIDNNSINDVYRGIRVSGIKSFPTRIADNHVTMREDPNGLAQHGIELSNCLSNATTYGKHVIVGNTLYSVGANTLTNSNASLVFCSLNSGGGLLSPSVTCNDVSKSFNGFVFEGPNQGTIWRGNNMSQLSKGMTLSNGGYIGTQGGLNLGTGNSWNGSTWTGSNYGTYCVNQSTVPLSILYRASSSGVSNPPNNSGDIFVLSYGFVPGGILTTTNGASYNCMAPTARSLPPVVALTRDYGDAGLFYIAQTDMYRFLASNDSVLNSDTYYSDFFDDLAGTSVDKFMQVESELAEDDLASATGIKSTVTGTNNVEDNYLTFYDLYITYAGNNFEPTNNIDSTNLLNLSLRCPGTDGACIYQARALFNSVYKESYAYPVCSSSGSKLAGNFERISQTHAWKIDLYPNPAKQNLSIHSSIEDDIISVSIADLSGRTLFNQKLKLKGFIANLDVNLIDGVYIVTIINSGNDNLTKKLLINR